MRPKVIGVGLNKTATKSLSECLTAMGYNNQTYSLEAFTLYRQQDWDALFAIMDQHDSFEDWPWPLMYRQIDERYPDAKFILTTRATPEVWYRSLCKMAVRMGPLNKFEKHIYGYSMPQGRRDQHVEFYLKHNEEVKAYFSDRPGKLLELCFDTGVSMAELCHFLGQPECDFIPPHVNKSDPVYAGESLARAHVSRIVFQTKWYAMIGLRKVKAKTMMVFRAL